MHTRFSVSVHIAEHLEKGPRKDLLGNEEGQNSGRKTHIVKGNVNLIVLPFSSVLAFFSFSLFLSSLAVLKHFILSPCICEHSYS